MNLKPRLLTQGQNGPNAGKWNDPDMLVVDVILKWLMFSFTEFMYQRWLNANPKKTLKTNEAEGIAEGLWEGRTGIVLFFCGWRPYLGTLSNPGFFFNFGTPGGGGDLPPWGPKMTQKPEIFLTVLIQTLRKNAICACPRRDPPHRNFGLNWYFSSVS